jgi:hypothetical protein
VSKEAIVILAGLAGSPVTAAIGWFSTRAYLRRRSYRLQRARAEAYLERKRRQDGREA